MSTQQRPAGWYPDPYGEGPLRWYDGGWTKHVRDKVPSREPEPGPYIDRRTSSGRNYNNGRYPNPYMSDDPAAVWGGIKLILFFVVLPFLVLVVGC
jgi:hypothetical protein